MKKVEMLINLEDLLLPNINRLTFYIKSNQKIINK